MSEHAVLDISRDPVERMPAPQPESALPMSIVEFAIKNGAGIDTIERLVAMQERAEDREAQRAFNEALAEMQGALPVIERHGKITIREKGNEAKVIQSTPYALWEDINEAIKPVLKEHGFALSFRTGIAADGKLTVTGILKHRLGHQEETTLALPHDSTGSKNAVQAVGSSTSYGKRYTASALLNLTSRGEDDDGKAGGTGALVSDEQLQALRDLIETAEADEVRFCKHLGIKTLPELPASRYDEAQRALGAKLEKKGARQ